MFYYGKISYGVRNGQLIIEDRIGYGTIPTDFIVNYLKHCIAKDPHWKAPFGWSIDISRACEIFEKPGDILVQDRDDGRNNYAHLVCIDRLHGWSSPDGFTTIMVGMHTLLRGKLLLETKKPFARGTSFDIHDVLNKQISYEFLTLDGTIEGRTFVGTWRYKGDGTMPRMEGDGITFFAGILQEGGIHRGDPTIYC